MAGISNRQVVEELKNGDRQGCEHLVELYQRLLIHETITVFRLDRRDAEEVVSDVLLAVVQKIGQFSFRKSENDFHYWVMAVFRNKVRDFLRRQTLTGGIESLFSENSNHENGEDSQPRTVVVALLKVYEESLTKEEEGEHGSSYRQKLQFLTEMLDRMKTWERVLLRCRALNVPFEDIARYTGKPVSQLKVYHPRVKRKLVRLLAARYPELQSQ